MISEDCNTLNNQKFPEMEEDIKGDANVQKESHSEMQLQTKKSSPDQIHEEISGNMEWNSIIPKEIIDSFVNEGSGKSFNILSNWINSNSTEISKSLGILIKFIRFKLKNWKENNVSIQIEGLKCLNTLCTKMNFSQDNSILILEASEIYKIKDF